MLGRKYHHWPSVRSLPQPDPGSGGGPALWPQWLDRQGTASPQSPQVAGVTVRVSTPRKDGAGQGRARLVHLPTAGTGPARPGPSQRGKTQTQAPAAWGGRGLRQGASIPRGHPSMDTAWCQCSQWAPNPEAEACMQGWGHAHAHGTGSEAARTRGGDKCPRLGGPGCRPRRSSVWARAMVCSLPFYPLSAR